MRAALTRATLELVDHSSSKPEELPSPPDPVAALPMAATDRYPSAASPAKAACPVLSPDLRFCPAGVREDTLDTIRPGRGEAASKCRCRVPNDPPERRPTAAVAAYRSACRSRRLGVGISGGRGRGWSAFPDVVIPVFHSQCEDPRSPVRRFVGSKVGPGADSVVIRPPVWVSFIRSVAPGPDLRGPA